MKLNNNHNHNHKTLIYILIIIIILVILYRIIITSRYENYENENENKNKNETKQSKAKIAFLFLTYNNLKRPDIWNKFFENAPKDKYSIYLHAKEPEKITDELLKGKQISKHIETCWGCFSCVEANIYMMQEAMKDENNKKFVIVSDSCCPTLNFNNFYNKVMSNDNSIIKIHANNGNPERYDQITNPLFTKDKFIKHCAQGLIFNRKHAQILIDRLNNSNDSDDWKKCSSSDEHYFGNILLNLDTDFNKNNDDYKATFDIWQIDDLDKSKLKKEDIQKDCYINLKSISNNSIDLIRNAKFLLIRKVNQDTNLDVDYLLESK